MVHCVRVVVGGCRNRRRRREGDRVLDHAHHNVDDRAAIDVVVVQLHVVDHVEYFDFDHIVDLDDDFDVDHYDDDAPDQLDERNHLTPLRSVWHRVVLSASPSANRWVVTSGKVD